MKNQTFKLIDGTFSAEEAKEILVKLYTNKIQFHELKNFSNNEMYGKDDPLSVKRIPELKETINSIKTLLHSCHELGKKVKVSTHVELNIEDGHE